MKLSKEQQERLAQLEKDAGDGDWGTDDSNIKAKQSEPLGVLPDGAKPVTVAELDGFSDNEVKAP